MELVPSFDQSTLDPQLTQGDMCSYADLDNSDSVSDFIAAHTF